MFAIRSSRTSRRRGPWPPERRGVAVVMFAVFLMLLMMFVAIAVDFSRVYVARNALQTAADAGAMAGALELKRLQSSAAGDSAKVYAIKNTFFGVTLSTDSVLVTPGQWIDTIPGRGFKTSGITWSNADAIMVRVLSEVRLQFAPLFGINGHVSTDTAIGWAGANVQATTSCVKPWAMPLKILKDSIHAYDPSTFADSPADTLSTVEKSAFDRMVQENSGKLNFILKQGTGSPDDNPGNFYNVKLPRVCSYADKTCDPNARNNGAQIYYDNVYDSDDPSGCTKNLLARGDILETQPGVSPQQTINRVEDFCAVQPDYNGADCNGIPIKAAFFGPMSSEALSWSSGAGYSIPQADKDAGMFAIEIKLVGGFILQSVSVDNTDKGNPKSQITGRFTTLDDKGPTGNAPSLLRRTFLVK